MTAADKVKLLRAALAASHELLRWQRVRPDITRQLKRNERALRASAPRRTK